jgi:hypothetical protein
MHLKNQCNQQNPDFNRDSSILIHTDIYPSVNYLNKRFFAKHHF